MNTTADQARLVRDLQRRLQAAVTDLAENISDRLDSGDTLDDIAADAGMSAQEAAALVRAEATRVSNRRYHRRRAADIKAGRIQPRHGTSEALPTGCRCDPCEQLRQRRRQALAADRRQGLPDGHPDHGTRAGYTRWGCLCDRCRAAAAAYRAARPQKRTDKVRAREREYARRRRASLTPEELERVRHRDRQRWAKRNPRRRRPSLPWTPVNAPPDQWRRLREQAGVTMAAIAARLDVHSSVVSRWETGKINPGEQSQRRYLDALNALASARTTDGHDHRADTHLAESSHSHERDNSAD